MEDKKALTAPSLPELFDPCWGSTRGDSNTSFWSGRTVEPFLMEDRLKEFVMQLVLDDEEESERSENRAPAGETQPPARHARSEMSPVNVNVNAVTISSKDDFASSKPIGFQRIVPNRPKPARGSNRKRESVKLMMCNFCKNDPDFRKACLTHSLRDPSTNTLTCPYLRRLICKRCGGTGDTAHTLKYCPMNVAAGRTNP